MLSQMGPHIIRTTAEALAYARVAPCVKGVDNVEVLAVARPDAKRIFRHDFANQNLTDPSVAVRSILAALGSYRHPLLYVETYNEIGKGGRDQYIRFLQIAVPILHAAGLKVCGPCWGTGDFEQPDWDAFRAAHWCGLDLIGLHCYWGFAGFSPWEALRYRTYWRPGDPNIAITECGRDAVEGGKAGYVLDGVSPQQYASELLAYGVETAKDPYVVAVLPFTWGPTPDWNDFDNDPLTATILAAQQHAGGNVITDAEFGRLVGNVYSRANVPYNPGSALTKYFAAQLRAGHYLGAPEEPEHDSEDGSLVLQRFASAYLWCRKSDYVVQAGALPFA